ncbi:CoA-binding protein [Loktanella sp. IMCC34160]|uniref:CoA-binding protein n=1 Tax=Loktanella sp. IMCC34160 TaxID=2510646 RepID=UPI00101E035E|nr:CoA-binding protein [Loktanella sp. IMCC34160]RYG93137.1 CoA-binding protein [Loktanella sp. IMCC34160]
METQDDMIRRVLAEARVIALVGYSANADRPSHQVARFLQDRGHRVIPVNPGLAGQEQLGEVVRADLASVPEEVDMVDVFRASDAVPEIVEAALGRWPELKTLWLQLGISHAEATARARAAGATVIENRCPKIEYARLGL